jgi:predicted acyltransferase
MYAAELTDPEGLLSTLPAIVTALLGYWTGLFIQRHSAPAITLASICLLIVAGAAIAAVGLAWDFVLPINKKLWTSSYVLLTGGLAMMGLAACLALFDRAGFRRLTRPFEIVGVNAITVFVGSGLLARTLGAIRLDNTSVQGWIYKHAFLENLADLRLPVRDLADQVAGLQLLWPLWLALAFLTDIIADPRFASLLFALLTVAFWWLVAAIMARRGWSLRV